MDAVHAVLHIVERVVRAARGNDALRPDAVHIKWLRTFAEASCCMRASENRMSRRFSKIKRFGVHLALSDRLTTFQCARFGIAA